MVIYARPVVTSQDLLNTPWLQWDTEEALAEEAWDQDASAEGNAKGAPSQGEGEQRRTVLVIEDDPDFRRMLITSLESRFGYRVLYATRGLAGIRMVAREQPDLILMDLAMPEMDGLVATRLLKRSTYTAHIPVIAFSNYGRVSTWQQRASDAGCALCLDKSIPLAELHEAIESVLNGD
jgi:CheY-like chemotaxis protein